MQGRFAALANVEQYTNVSYVSTSPLIHIRRSRLRPDVNPAYIMSGHGAFNAYLFCTKLAESAECTNCDGRGRDDDAWYSVFECPAFQLYWEDVPFLKSKVLEQSLFRWEISLKSIHIPALQALLIGKICEQKIFYFYFHSDLK